MVEQKGGNQSGRWALMVVALYLTVGILWILFSDRLVVLMFDDVSHQAQAQTWKGWVFVVITAGALYGLLLRQFRLDRSSLQLQLDQQEEILRLSQFRESVIDNASIWINVLDQEGRVMVWNKAAEAISGYRAAEVIGHDQIWQWLYPDGHYRQEILGQVSRILGGDHELEGYETRIQTRKRGQRLIVWNSRPLRNSDDEMVGSIAIGRDITESRHAQLQLQARERELAAIMDNLPGMAYLCRYDEHWTMLFVSSGCEELTGYRPDDLLNNRTISWADLILPEYGEILNAAVEEAIASAESYSIEYQIRHRDGSEIWVWERGRAVDEHGELVLEGIIMDISERKRLEGRLSELATMDALTGQYNRRETERIMAEEVARAERYQRSLAVLWVDLDHFKRVNDNYGHGVGDQVLRAVSQRMADTIRSVDTLGRYGGEEFIVVLPEMAEQDALDAAERLRREVADQPIRLDQGRSLSLTISIGVSVFPAHGRTAEDLLEAADRAMYTAKEAGRNRVSLAREPVRFGRGESGQALADPEDASPESADPESSDSESARLKRTELGLKDAKNR